MAHSNEELTQIDACIEQGKRLTELVGCEIYGFSPGSSFGITMPGSDQGFSIPQSLVDAICKLQKPNESS